MGSSDRFVYPRIAGAIRKKIEDREYPLGSKIPSERELAEEFYVNRMTVRRALSILESEGLIQRKRGSGTFASSVPRKGDVCRLKGGQQDTDMENAVLCACVFPDGGTDRGQRCA